MSSHPRPETESGRARDWFHLECGQGDAAPPSLAETLAFGALCRLVGREATPRPPRWETSQAAWRGHVQATSQLVASASSGAGARTLTDEVEPRAGAASRRCRLLPPRPRRHAAETPPAPPAPTRRIRARNRSSFRLTKVWGNMSLQPRTTKSSSYITLTKTFSARPSHPKLWG